MWHRGKKYFRLFMLIAMPAVGFGQIGADSVWRLEDIYNSRRSWQVEYLECLKQLSSGDETLVRSVQPAINRLLRYAQLTSDADMNDREAEEMVGKAEQLKLNADAVESGMKQLNYDPAEKISADSGSIPGIVAGSIIRMLNYRDIPREDFVRSDCTVIRLDYQQLASVRTSADPRERTLAMKKFWEHQHQFGDTLALLLNEITRQHYIHAGQKGFSGCLEAVLVPDSVPTEVYSTLINTVRKNLGPMHRYIRLKQNILGLDTFRYADLYAQAIPEVAQEIPYSQAKRILRDAFHTLGEEYLRALDTSFAGGWIDVYPRPEKYPGAWSTGVYGVHPYILMNYSGTFESLTILAHELGHALHFWFASQNQPFQYADPGPFLSEVPSMLNETLLLQWILEQEHDERIKLFLLDGYLERIRNGIYRQTLFAEFDLLKHKQIEAGQALNKQWLDSTYLALVREYYGHAAGITEVDGYICCEWSMVPDADLNFVVYQYPVGVIAAITLAEKVTSPEGSAAWIRTLKAGGSKNPFRLLKEAGVDLSMPGPFENAIQQFDRLVSTMEDLYAKVEGQR